jgi:hypothetical protein
MFLNKIIIIIIMLWDMQFNYVYVAGAVYIF